MLKPSAEVVFAFRMFCVRYHLTPADVMKIMVAMERKDDKETSG